MKAVIYARYSSDSQREESIEGQLRECKEYAEKNSITIVGTYIDRAFSARTDNRPEFQRMIKDSAKTLFDAVIVWKLDRFSRNRYDSAVNKSILRKNGVRLLSAKEPIAEDATGIMLESILEGYAEYYSAELSEKVVRGQTENALKCKFNGGTLPLGYTVDAEHHFQIDPVIAPIINEVFQRYDGGDTITEIVAWLETKGVRTNRGKKVSFNCVNRMLHNKKYTGEFRYRDVVSPDSIPSIVSKELFDRVAQRLQKNKKAPGRHKAEDDYLLSTKLFCGKCGTQVVGECGTSGTSKIYHYYKCLSAKRRWGCRKKAVKKSWLENLVVRETVRRAFGSEVIGRIADKILEIQKRENTEIPILRKQLADVERAIENMLDAIQQGILTKSTRSRLDELEENKEQLEVSIVKEEMRRPRLTREQIVGWFERFCKLDLTKKEHRAMLIDSFVNAIYLYDDRLVITFNYKEGSETIGLQQVSSSDLVSRAAPTASR